jgi:hypothetical protein
VLRHTDSPAWKAIDAVMEALLNKVKEMENEQRKS